MVKLRDLAEANKKEGDILLSNTPQKLTTEIKEKVFKNKLPIDVVDDSQNGNNNANSQMPRM